jgi:hypothetical protein
MNLLSKIRPLFLILLLGWTTTILAQQNYGFVSPNTRENLKLADAIKGMNSVEEAQLQLKAINMSCVVRSKIRAYKALGSWSDGAEHSVLLRLEGDEATLRYVLSRMGRDAQQKYVIYFRPDPAGKADLYVLRLPTQPGNFVALSSTLEQSGIPFRTVVPLGKTTAIYIIDLDRNLRDKIFAAARKLRAQVSFEPGNALLFGDDERAQAKAKFEQEINSYEANNPNLPPTCDAQRKAVAPPVNKANGKESVDEVKQPLY